MVEADETDGYFLPYPAQVVVITNIEADRMEIQGEKMMVYSRGRLVYVADLGQIMLAKLTPGRDEAR